MQATMKVLLDGYWAACRRFDAARQELDEVAGFRATFEALEWAVSIDEVIGHRWAPEGKPLDWEWRERVPGAESMDGLRFARNRVHHHWAAALEIRRADAWYPPREFEFRWKRIEDLPPAEGKRASKRGAERYRRFMAGRSADVVLSTMDEAFHEVQQFLEMPGSPAGLKGPFFEPNPSAVKPAKQYRRSLALSVGDGLLGRFEGKTSWGSTQRGVSQTVVFGQPRDLLCMESGTRPGRSAAAKSGTVTSDGQNSAHANESGDGQPFPLVNRLESAEACRREQHQNEGDAPCGMESQVEIVSQPGPPAIAAIECLPG